MLGVCVCEINCSSCSVFCVRFKYSCLYADDAELLFTDIKPAADNIHLQG